MDSFRKGQRVFVSEAQGLSQVKYHAKIHSVDRKSPYITLCHEETDCAKDPHTTWQAAKYNVKDATLFWNEQGQICCQTHAPYKGTDTWNWERWRKVALRDIVANKLQCESCHFAVEAAS